MPVNPTPELKTVHISRGGTLIMIMLLTHHNELREQIREALQHNGYTVITPPHRGDMLTVLKDAQPDLIILDLYLSHPSGAEDLKNLREHGYQGKIIVLSAPSMTSVLKEAYASGIDRVVTVPAKIQGRFDLGELQSSIKSCLRMDLSGECV
jgi:DNA-binding response OmpR family regulator